MTNEKITKTIEFFKQRKVINTIIIILFFAVLISSTSIRLQNMPLLIDQTTGEHIPLALDPYYFLRVSQTILNEGSLPGVDIMRYPSLNLPFTQELTPYATVLIYKVINIFHQVSLQFANVISPVIFFVLGLIIFFFLVYSITNSKYIAILSFALLAFIPPYLYRTMAGFSDHESIGMFAFFLTLLIYSLILKYLERDNKPFIKTILYSFILAVSTIFTMLSWGGAFSFIIMIIPLSFLIIWLIKFKQPDNLKSMMHYMLFYILWVIFMVLMGYFVGVNIIPRFVSSSGIIGAFMFGFVFVEYILSYLLSKGYLDNFKEKIVKYRILFSGGVTVFAGILLLPLVGKSIISILTGIFYQLIKPFGTERVALTVAENAQPYLMDWIHQIGKILFWLSFAGMALIGFRLGNQFSTNKGKKTFCVIWVVLISSMLFSRIYPGAALDGINFFSQLIYIGGILLFLILGLKIYSENEIKLDSGLILLITLILISILSLRSASRVFFLVVPFTCIYASYFVIKIKDYINDNDELFKWLFILLFITSIFGAVNILYTSYNQIDAQAKFTGPSANYQWQGAMSWVRENTHSKDIFVSWWDYGYWVQYLGQRPTITDGGHGNAYWDHLIGRYVLTNKNPDTALSFMKSHNISYLLIDQTEFGKYPAYSKIGGDENYDSFSILSVGLVDNKQTVETRDSITRVYPIGGVVDEDIIYEFNGVQTFLPGPTYNKIGEPSYKAYLSAIILENVNDSFKQPTGIFIYNGKQFRLPLRYLYLNERLIDFKSGIESVAYFFPKIDQTSNGQINIDYIGAMSYLSPKVSKSLFAQLYLLNNVFNNYPTVNLAHSENEMIVQNLKSQGANIGDIVYFNGFRGPIKIFKINYNDDVQVHKEFTSLSGEYGELDYIK